MRNWGLGFLICGALAIIGLIAEPQEDYKEGLHIFSSTFKILEVAE